MINKKYEALKKKYNLPSFEILDNEFEISLIEDDFFSLREIRRRVLEKIEFYIKILEDLLQTDIRVSTLYEIKSFDDSEMEYVFKIYQKLMKIMRESALLNLNNDEKKNADFIINVFKEWNEIKKELSKILEKLKCSWEKEEDKKEILGYFG